MNDVIKNVTDVGATTKRTNYSDFFRSFLVVVALLFGSCVVLACVILRQREVNTYTRVQNSILNDTVYSTVTRGNTLFEAPKNGVDTVIQIQRRYIRQTVYMQDDKRAQFIFTDTSRMFIPSGFPMDSSSPTFKAKRLADSLDQVEKDSLQIYKKVVKAGVVVPPKHVKGGNENVYFDITIRQVGIDINMLSLNPKIKVTPYKKGWLFPKFGYYLSSENPYIPLNDTIPPR